MLPVLLTEALTIAANQLLGVDPFLKLVAAATIFFLTFALGLRPRRAVSALQRRRHSGRWPVRRRHVHDCRRRLDHCHHRAGRLAIVDAPDVAQTARFRYRLTPERYAMIVTSFSARTVCMATWWLAMRSGVKALDEMRK